MVRKSLLVGVALGAVGVLMIAALLPAMAGYAETVFVHGGRGFGGRGGWWRNATVTQEQVQYTGTLSDLDLGLMVLSTQQGEVKLSVPNVLVVENRFVSLVKLVFDGKLRKGDRIEVDALRVTVTLPNGSSRTSVIVQQIRDLDTGLVASSWGGARVPPSTPSTQQQTTA
ncbi:MAG: hypothetical protein QXO17_05690 [Nitrososphaerota archaeon]|nr:hypothetical protein [Candidatus Calditenuis fumarioli]